MEKTEEKASRLYPSTRLFVFLLVFLGSTMLGGGFAAFNFGIVCMVNETAIANEESASNRSEESIIKLNGYDGEFDWDKSTQANLIAAHAFGAIVFNLPSGLLSDRYGSKVIFGLSILLNGLANAVTPSAAYAGAGWLFCARLLQGVGTGASWPSMLAMVSRWGTPTDTGMLIALGAAGYQFGPLLAMTSSSVICDSRLRWPFIFYVWAGLSLLFVVLWFLLYVDDPKKCRYIGDRERDYVSKYNMRKSYSTQSSFWDVPWKRILFSPCVIAVYLCQFSCTWAIFYVGEFMPTYSKEVLHFDVRNNGFTSALPALCQVITRSLSGLLADKITFGNRSKTFSIKFFTFTSTVIPCLCFVVLAFLDSRQSTLAVATFCTASVFMATGVVGYSRAGVLVAARYAGLVAAVGNLYSYAAAIVMPYAVGAMAADGTVSEWKGTLFLVAAVLCLGGIQFQIFGTAQEQEWATGKKSTHKVYVVEDGPVVVGENGYKI